MTREGSGDLFILRLYLVGSAPNSLLALANLRTICNEYLPDRYQIEVVDILQEPLRALEDGIFLTPSLVRISPTPMVRIVGSLSDFQSVIETLGIG